MDEMEQLIAQIKSGTMSQEKLKELLEMANSQLSRYEQGLKVINKSSESFTFEDYQETLRLCSGGNQGSMLRSEWDQMFPDHKLKLRDQVLGTIKQGQESFVKIKSALESQLSQKKSGCFIATAACGYNSSEVIELTRFRDNVLSYSILGRLFIRFYYMVSPSMASLIQKSPKTKALIRFCLIKPIASVIKKMTPRLRSVSLFSGFLDRP